MSILIGIFIGILIGFGLNSILTKITDWVESRYIDCYMNEVNEEIQKNLKA